MKIVIQPILAEPTLKTGLPLQHEVHHILPKDTNAGVNTKGKLCPFRSISHLVPSVSRRLKAFRSKYSRLFW